MLEAGPAVEEWVQSLGLIYLPSSVAASGQVPLSAIASVREESAPLAVNHLGQFPAATVSFNLAPGASLGAAVDAIAAAGRDVGLPPTLARRFQGAAPAFPPSPSNHLFPIPPPP